MAWTTNDIPNLSGRTAVVTGANGGLGLETARALAAAGAHVVLAARSPKKTEDAVADIRATVTDPSLEVVPLDLGSLASVQEAAEKIAAGHHVVDILVNNAGIMGIPEQTTADGFEMQFGVDHLGHWAFTSHLLPNLLRSERTPRIVTVTSSAHHMGFSVNPKNPHLRDGKYGPWKMYGQAKLANFHFALGLQRELAAAGATVESLTAHPGLSHTELQVVSAEEAGGISQNFFKWAAASMGMAPAQGALPQLRAATDPTAKGGQMYAPRFFTFGAAVRRPILRPGSTKAIAKLWEVSERETGVRLDVAAALVEARAS